LCQLSLRESLFTHETLFTVQSVHDNWELQGRYAGLGKRIVDWLTLVPMWFLWKPGCI
jgi:hypothetical protein